MARRRNSNRRTNNYRKSNKVLGSPVWKNHVFTTYLNNSVLPSQPSRRRRSYDTRRSFKKINRVINPVRFSNVKRSNKSLSNGFGRFLPSVQPPSIVRLAICADRKKRREVIFAIGKGGKGGSKFRKIRLRPSSFIKC